MGLSLSVCMCVSVCVCVCLCMSLSLSLCLCVHVEAGGPSGILAALCGVEGWRVPDAMADTSDPISVHAVNSSFDSSFT